MALNILELLVGDTNYISKHNSNNSVLQAAVETLQVQIGSGPTAAINFPIYAQTITGSGSGRLDVAEIQGTDAGSGTLAISSGTVWIGASASMRSAGAVVLDFSSEVSGTYYTHVDATGAWSFDTEPAEKVHTIDWSGSAFNSITQPDLIWSNVAYLDSLYSTEYTTTYDSLNDRLDYIETNAAGAFTGLSDTPADFTGQTLKGLRVNAGETALEYVNIASDFTDLADTPADFTGHASKVVSVNVGETALEFTTPTTGATVFTGLTDTPANFTGHASKVVSVNVGETALEFTTPTTGTTVFTGLTDTPANFTGHASKVVSVNVGETALEFTTPTTGTTVFTGLTDTPANFTGHAGKQIKVNSGETALEFVAEPYDVGGTYNGAPTASVVLLRYPMPRAVDFPSALAGSQGVAGVAATAQTDFDIQKDGVSVGTMRFAAAATTSTFIMASATSFAIGEVLTVVAPATPDSTLADIGFALIGTR